MKNTGKFLLFLALSFLWGRGEIMAEDKEISDFTFPNIEGGLNSLSEFKGQKILLIHFASW
jgi:hypothetical protein